MFNCQDARIACYLVFQSALKQLIVEFARIFYTQIFMQNYPVAQNWYIYSSQRRVDNARESVLLRQGLGSSEMLTINLHGIGRHTRRPGPGISIYLKFVGCSISLLDYTEVQSTQYQNQISHDD